MASSSGQKREHETIDLGSTDEDEPAPKQRVAAPATTAFSLPPGARELRGVAVPDGWTVHGGSMLVKVFGDFRPSAAIAAFDFDGCLARTPLGGNDPKAWSMQYPHVPQVLSTLSAAHAIVIVTNESMDRFKKPEAIRAAILKKTGRLEGFAAAAKVPLLALCATAKDDFRKPGLGAWRFTQQIASGAGKQVDAAASFFVGDAAGRQGDHSDSDLAFARGAGLPFFNEKAFFEQEHPPK